MGRNGEGQDGRLEVRIPEQEVHTAFKNRNYTRIWASYSADIVERVVRELKGTQELWYRRYDYVTKELVFESKFPVPFTRWDRLRQLIKGE